MKDDKKKLAIVGVLAFIVIGVGAFQFMGAGSSGGAKVPPKAKPTATTDKDEHKVKNPEFVTALPVRDPFKAAGPDLNAPQKAKPEPPKAPRPPAMRGNLGNEMLPSAGNIGFKPLVVAPPEPTLNYRLSGLILGHHPAAVFTDASGSQRLIPVGGSLDGDAQLLSVTKGRAVVSFHGKHVALSLGGTPIAN